MLYIIWPRWQGSRSGGEKLSNNDRLIDKIDIRVARKLSINQAKEYGVLPIYEDGKNVYIATTETPHNEIIDILSFLFNKKIKLIYREKDEILELIQNVLNFKIEDIEVVIFEEAIACNASDIHYEPEENGLNIRFRINGSLTLVRKLSLEDYQKISSRLKIKAGMDITEKEDHRMASFLCGVRIKNIIVDYLQCQLYMERKLFLGFFIVIDF